MCCIIVTRWDGPGGIEDFLVCDHEFLSVGLCMQDYKSLRVAVMICASVTLVNKRTDTF